MNIVLMEHNNTTFSSLNAPRKLKLAYDLSRKDLLAYPSIKECADKYDVCVKRGRLSGYIETERNSFIGAGVGAGAGILTAIGLVNIGAPLALGLLFGGMFTMMGTAFGVVKQHEEPTYEYLLKGKKGNIETNEYQLIKPEDLSNIPSLTKEIEEKQKQS